MERQFSGRKPRIVILGSGNVATHLAKALDDVGDVVQVWSRNLDHARELSTTLRIAEPVTGNSGIDPTADFYIISVSDDAIPHVAKILFSSRVKGIIAHTSGSYKLDDLRAVLDDSMSFGVFYPLQTFSKSVDLDLSEVPFFIEGCDGATTEALLSLARSISTNVCVADSVVRGHLHVAAVFANNFANYAWDIADNYLKRNIDMDISVFRPLLEETLRKAMANGPRNSQTGPARRGDENVMREHLSKLSGDEAEVYALLSEKINKIHHPNSQKCHE